VLTALSQDVGGAVVGQVLGLEGKPAANVRVAVSRVWNAPNGVAPAPFPSYVSTTDKAGRYRMTGIDPGRYYLLAGRVDDPTYYPGTQESLHASILTVAANSSAERLDFQLVIHPGATISGRVDVDWGEDRRSIGLMRFEPSFLREDVAVESDGSFVFRGIPPGSYKLNVYPSGLFWDDSAIEVKDKRITGIRREAFPIASIRGSVEVVGTETLPIVGLEVRVGSRKIRTGVGWDRTSRQPYINLPQGEVRISKVDLPGEYRIESFTYGKADLLKDRIRVSRDQHFSLKLSVPNASQLRRIRGRVEGFKNLATHLQSRVTLAGPSMLNPVDAEIQSDGSYEFSGVRPGTYSLGVGNRVRGMVTVEKNDVEVDLVIPVIRKVNGRVLVAGGGPIPRFDLEFEKVPEDSEYGVSRAPGTFEVWLPDGDVRMKFYGYPDGYEIQSITFGGSDLLREPLRIAGSNLPEILVTMVRR
jgi:hypothetical protein